MQKPVDPARGTALSPYNDAPDDENCVHILMAVYQGETYLREQLASFTAQTHSNWRLWASVDIPPTGADKSLAILKASDAAPVVLQGPGKGATANFISLMKAAPAGAIWAFADQDDVWFPNKLESALRQLNQVPRDIPALYCARMWITDRQLGNRKISPARPRPSSFENALVQNIASGNTTVLNGAATRLIAQITADMDIPVIHDWWLYQVITGVGGRVIHDNDPVLLYRQHDQNVIGANDSWAARRLRLRHIFKGIWSDWTDRNIAMLENIRCRLSDQNQVKLSAFSAARNASLFRRVTGLRRCGIYRQSTASGVIMWIAAVLNRL